MSETSPTHLGVEELCTRWRVRPPVIYGLRYRGEGPAAIRIGRVLRFPLASVEAWERDHLESVSS